MAPNQVMRLASASHTSGVISGSCRSSAGRNSRYHRAATLITATAGSRSSGPSARIDRSMMSYLCLGAEPAPHHGSRLLPASDFFEAGSIVHALRSEPHEVRMAALSLVNRIGFQERGAMGAGIVDSRFEERLRNPPPSLPSVDEEADDRPHGSVVDSLHHGRAFEPTIVLAGPKRDPPHGPPGLVADQPGDVAAVDERLHGTFVALTARSMAAGPGSSVVHTPAVSNDRPSRPAEQLDQVVPAIL